MADITQKIGNTSASIDNLGVVYGKVAESEADVYGDVSSVAGSGLKITGVSNIDESCLSEDLKTTIDNKQDSMDFATDDDVQSMFTGM